MGGPRHIPLGAHLTTQRPTRKLLFRVKGIVPVTRGWPTLAERSCRLEDIPATDTR